MANVPTSLNNFKIKVDDLDLGKLKAAPVDLKKIRDLVDNQVVKNTKFNAINTKVNKKKLDKKLDEKIPDRTTLIRNNQKTKISKI